MTSLAAAVAWPDISRARSTAKISTIGFLGLAPASAWSSEIEALRAGLRDLGYVEGQNIAIEFRWASSVGDMPALSRELVELNVDVIVAPASTRLRRCAGRPAASRSFLPSMRTPLGQGMSRALRIPEEM